MPEVTVVIPTYLSSSQQPQQVEALQAALESVLKQDFPDVQIIIVDDGSPTPLDASAFEAIDPRVHCIRQANQGPAVARNLGILSTSSRYVAFLDADDLWREPKLGRQCALMEQHPEYVLCYTDFSRGPDPQSTTSRLAAYRPRTPGQEFYDLLRENFLLTSSVLIRRDALARSGLFSADLRGPEDIDLWLRLAQVGRFGFVDEVLAYKRDHETNISSSIQFTNNSITLLKRLESRFRSDREALALIRTKLRRNYDNLGYRARLEGKYADARRGYFHSALMGHRPLRGLALTMLLSLPTQLANAALHWINADARMKTDRT